MEDSLETLICPACGSELTKVFIPDKGINIDVCAQGCGGMYFDNKEIQEFSGENEDLSDIKKLLADKNFMPVDETAKRICPSCGTPMAKTNALGIQIDTCYKCGGIFLDNGEFEHVRKKFKKREKIQTVELNQNSDIKLQEFYKDAQDELYRAETYDDIAWTLSRRRTPLSLLFRLFF